MRHVRTLTLMLMAACAVMAFGASGAWAKFTPEWGRCEATAGGTGGHYGNANCTAPVKTVHGQYLGGYEWHPAEGDLTVPRELIYDQPVQTSTITFAGGFAITCSRENNAPLEDTGGQLSESGVHFSGPTLTGPPAELDFVGCAPSGSSEEEKIEEEAWCHSSDGGGGR